MVNHGRAGESQTVSAVIRLQDVLLLRLCTFQVFAPVPPLCPSESGPGENCDVQLTTCGKTWTLQ